jgi:hypothetical protein
MDLDRTERRSAATGLASLVLGGLGGALEKGWPNADETSAVTAFIEAHRFAILAQSMLMMASGAAFVWFLGTLRLVLLRAEGREGRVTAIAFAMGVTWAALGFVAQALQVGQAMARPAVAVAPMLWAMSATFGIANLPLTLMLVAFAALSFRHHAFPTWLAWISVAAAIAQLLLWFSVAIRTGPLAPNGWLTYSLYPLFAVWLIPTSVLMMRGRRVASVSDAKETARRIGDGCVGGAG